MSGHLSIGERWRTVSLHFDQGLTSGEIARYMNCTSRTVRNILQLFVETNDVVERQGRGRTLLNKSDKE
jgi:transcriptional antiterminator